MEKYQCIIDLQSEEEESRGDRTCEVKLVIRSQVIDHEKSEDRRSGPEAFIDSKVGKGGSSS
jgi:hypothetical protein